MTPTKHAYGWKPQLPDFRDLEFSPHVGFGNVISLPAFVDLRPYMPPIVDQGDLGSCTANMAAALLWYSETRHRNDSAVPVFSRLFIYYNERSLEHTVRSDSGASIRDSIKAVNKFGACPETQWPYDVSKFSRKPTVHCYAYSQTYTAKTYQAVKPYLASMQAALAQSLPIAVGFTVYESFETDEIAKTGLVPMPTLEEKAVGGHAVLLVGYDDLKKHFIARNSWGESWGDKGYFYLPYQYILNPNLASDFWVIDSM